MSLTSSFDVPPSGDTLLTLRCQLEEFETTYLALRQPTKCASSLLFNANCRNRNGSDFVKKEFPVSLIPPQGRCSQCLQQCSVSSQAALPDARSQMDDMFDCLELIDKCYEWTLKAVELMASLKVEGGLIPLEKEAEAEAMQELLNNLLIDGSTSLQANLDKMSELSDKLSCDKLQEQCDTVRGHCARTRQLLEARLAATPTKQSSHTPLKRDAIQDRSANNCKFLMNATSEQELRSFYNDVFLSDNLSFNRHRSSYCSMPSLLPVLPSASPLLRNRDTFTHQDANTDGPIWVLNSSSTRHSYPVNGSLPGEGHWKNFTTDMQRRRTWDTSLDDSKERWFGADIITQDLSHRVVTTLSRTRSQSDICDTMWKDSGNSGSTILCAKSGENTQITQQSQSSSSKPAKPHTKLLRKAMSCVISSGDHSDSASPWSPSTSNSNNNNGMTDNTLSVSQSREPLNYINIMRQRRLNKCSSYTTNSSESLPSLPEEDDITAETQWDLPRSAPPSYSRLSSRRQRLLAVRSEINLRLTEEQQDQRRRIASAFQELVQTEKDYIRALQYVIENYMSELTRHDVPQTLRGKRNVVFGNWEKIYSFHSQYFLSELQQCDEDPLQIGRVFLNNAEEFYCYALYSKNKPKSDELMTEYGNFFFKNKQRLLKDKLDLGSYLLKPIQRMGKYALLLKQIIKDCNDTDMEVANIQAAHDMMKFYMRHGNDLLAMDSILNSDVSLQEQGMLLRQDEMMIYQGRKRMQRRVFLFEELIVFCKTRKTLGKQDIYHYKSSLKITDIGLTESADNLGLRFEIWFRKRKAREIHVMQAPTPEIKIAWVKELSNLLWKQACKNREQQLTMNVHMGVGNKPCLDLKPSCNNISNRFVPTRLARGQVNNACTLPASQCAKKAMTITCRPQSVISLSPSDILSSAASSSGYSSSSSSASHSERFPASLEINLYNTK